MFSSCATILNPKYQKVTVIKPPMSEILVDGKAPMTKKGKILLQRDRKAKQITVNKEGYKSANISVAQAKKSPWYIMSVVPFGILFYPIFYDIGNRAYDYDKEIDLSNSLVELPSKTEKSKDIQLISMAANIEKEDLKYRYFVNYKQYKKKKDSKGFNNDTNFEEIKFKNTIFSYSLNQILAEQGYIDTSNVALKTSYQNNLKIKASVNTFNIHHINIFGMSYGQNSGIVYTDIKINWKVLDIYEVEIYNLNTSTTSGMFNYNSNDNSEVAIENAVKDAVEYGLVEFLKDQKVDELLHDYSESEIEEQLTELTISTKNKYVSTMGEAIASSVTIKTDKGHGSGFVIGADGYIATNYHVIAGSKKVDVITNDESKYEGEVIRFSKIHDLAIIKINRSGFASFKINKDISYEIAQEVYAVGTPRAEDLSQTVSRGIISGIRKNNENEFIQTDASVNHGNSGGALVNSDAEVIGMVTSKLSGVGVEGVAFGIPSKRIVESLKINFN